MSDTSFIEGSEDGDVLPSLADTETADASQPGMHRTITKHHYKRGVYKSISALDNALKARIMDSASKNIVQDTLVKPIHEYIRFNRNSINLVIGKRGSGKTFFTLREIVKLVQLDPDFGFDYTAVYYVSDKQSDDTVNIFQPFFKGRLKFKWITTDRALHLIEDIEAFTAKIINDKYHIPEEINAFYEDAIKKGEVLSDHKPDTKEFAIQHLNASRLLPGTCPNTILIFDDCLGLFKKDTKLARKLYQNRQMRMTAFLLLQDVQGISPSMKSNIRKEKGYGARGGGYPSRPKKRDGGIPRPELCSHNCHGGTRSYHPL